ncbi:MAG: ABC transporter substrate-binding protein [Acidobacteria bacterium]|nr:ABC transporter substrate-binding protein [Acidobacteriota bacterium]
MRVFLVLCCGAVIGATLGCGESAPETGSGSAPEALEPFALLIDWQAEPTYIGVYLARETGAFRRLGLDVEVVESSGADAAAAAVAEGRYPVATASGGATITAVARGASLVSTAVLYQQLPTVVYGLAAQGVEAPSDLTGKRVGIYPDSTTRHEFAVLLSNAGMGAEDVETVSIDGPDLPLVRSGEVDAAVNYVEMSPTELALQEETFRLALADHGVDAYGLNVIASRAAHEEDRVLIEGLTAAIVEGYRNACADRPAAAGVFLELFPDRDAGYVEASLRRVCELVGDDAGLQTAEGWQSTIDVYAAAGLLEGPVAPGDVLPDSR